MQQKQSKQYIKYNIKINWMQGCITLFTNYNKDFFKYKKKIINGPILNIF